MIFRGIYIGLIVLACSCQKTLPRLDGVDGTVWKRDKNACMGLRSAMKKDLDRQKEKLKRLPETQVIRLLGHPDKNELRERNRKLYVYYLDPSASCKKHTDLNQILIVRFNAVGIARDVFIRNDKQR